MPVIYSYPNKLSPLICDKISITLKVEYDDEPTIVNNINELLANGYGKRVYRSFYSLCGELGLGDFNQNKLLVQCQPKDSDRSFFRAEYNPAKAPIGDVHGFINRVLPGGYVQLMKHGICTRIDATIDIKKVHIDQLIFSQPGIRKTQAFYKGGHTETLYLGAKTSSKQICIYDKLAEIKRMNAKTWLEKVPVPDHPLTRIEARIKNKTQCNQLQNLANPFCRLNISDCSALDPSDLNTRLFLMTCQATNGQTTLLALPVTKRRRFRKLLEANREKWWNPTSIWEQWSSVAASIQKPPKPPY